MSMLMLWQEKMIMPIPKKYNITIIKVLPFFLSFVCKVPHRRGKTL